MDLAVLIRALKDQSSVNYAFLSPCTIFLYDYIVMLRLEIKLIWFSQWSYTKVLFLLVRYLAFVAVLLTIYYRMTVDLSAENCRTTFEISSWMLLSSTFFSQVILAVRTWAVWNRKTIIGVGLIILSGASAVVRYLVLHLLFKSLENPPPPYPGFRGCFLVKSMNIVWVSNAVIIAAESSFLGLMTISAFQSYRRGLNGELWNVIHKDGIVFYVYFLALTVLNLALSFTLPFYWPLLVSQMQQCIYSILTARIILAIRDTPGSQKGPSLELHTSYLEMSRFIIPLQFVHNEDHSQEQTVRTLSSRNN